MWSKQLAASWRIRWLFCWKLIRLTLAMKIMSKQLGKDLFASTTTLLIRALALFLVATSKESEIMWCIRWFKAQVRLLISFTFYLFMHSTFCTDGSGVWSFDPLFWKGGLAEVHSFDLTFIIVSMICFSLCSNFETAAEVMRRMR